MAALKRWTEVFGCLRPVIIGMIHVRALPGTPGHFLSVAEIVERAVCDARLYRDCGLDALMIENTHDTPYLRGVVGSEVTATMTRVASEVRRAVNDLVLGVQVLAGCNKAALAVALASGASFIRAECFVYSHVADEGWMDGCAGELLRYRKVLEAEEVLVLTDVNKKHCSHSPTLDLDIGQVAQGAEFFRSDGVIVTGVSTGAPASLKELDTVQQAVRLPLLVGSGVNTDNLKQYLGRVDGMIVGSEFKAGGVWSNDIDIDRVKCFMRRKHELLQP